MAAAIHGISLQEYKASLNLIFTHPSDVAWASSIVDQVIAECRKEQCETKETLRYIYISYKNV